MNYYVYQFRGKVFLVDMDTLQRQEVTKGYVAKVALLNHGVVQGMDELASGSDFYLVDSRIIGSIDLGLVKVYSYGSSYIQVDLLGDSFDVMHLRGELTLNDRVLCNMNYDARSHIQLRFCYKDIDGDFRFWFRLCADDRYVDFRVQYNPKKRLRYYIGGRWQTLK